jgi:pimeloyl-ACP methyl ester carboxylesterase
MQTHHVSAGGVRLAVHTSGQGMPVVFLHAFPLDHRMWSAQTPLAERCRLIMPDLRGFGGSRDAGPPQSIEQMADDVVALLDALHVDGPATICGCSMGGYVAQHVAARHPARVRSLVLVDTKLEADSPEARASRVDLANKVRSIGTRILAEAMVPRMVANTAKGAAARQAEITALLEGLIRGQEVDTIVAALAALAARPDMTAAARGMEMPALLVVGAEDAITPPECLERAEAIMPRARLLIVPGAGHLVPLEAPKVFNAALEAFL